jgi:hypothetical protein
MAATVLGNRPSPRSKRLFILPVDYEPAGVEDFGPGSTYFTFEITSRTRESWAEANSELSATGRSDRTRLFETTGKIMMIPSAKANATMNTKADVL